MFERAQVAQALLPVRVFAATLAVAGNRTAKSGCATGPVKIVMRVRLNTICFLFALWYLAFRDELGLARALYSTLRKADRHPVYCHET
jgi:hypothetical protein